MSSVNYDFGYIFQMPLSKKLKANAMAALFKTQSGFTVKRKGSITSSSLAKPCKFFFYN